jgi:hypothetical protein
MRPFSLVFLGFASIPIALASCAKGTTLDAVDTAGTDSGHTETSPGDGGSGATDSSAGGYGTGGADGDGGMGGMGNGGSGDGGMGGMGNGGAGGSDGGAGGSVVCDFSAPNNCAAAEQLTAVSGDEGDTTTSSGAGSKWFKIQVKETDSGILETDLSYKVSLTSPPGMDYDLYVKQGPQDGSPNCGATAVKGMLSGGSESVSNSWDDDQGIGGEDDSLWLSIEIVHVSGDNCDAKWSLTVVGDP